MVLDSLGQLHRVADSRLIASEVQGECRDKLAWPLLSRRLYSYSHLHDCEYKISKIINAKQAFFRLIPNLFRFFLCKLLKTNYLQF